MRLIAALGVRRTASQEPGRSLDLVQFIYFFPGCSVTAIKFSFCWSGACSPRSPVARYVDLRLTRVTLVGADHRPDRRFELALSEISADRTRADASREIFRAIQPPAGHSDQDLKISLCFTRFIHLQFNLFTLILLRWPYQ